MARPFEVRGLSDEGSLAGYGSVFGVEDSYQDIVAPGAFTRSLKERGLPKMLWQHDTAQPIGVWTRAVEDQKGLFLEGKIARQTRAGSDAYELLKMGALDGLSIGFSTKESKYDEKTDVRTLLDVDLWEVSPVTFPANEAARIEEVRAMTHSDIASLASQLGKLYGSCRMCLAGSSRDELMGGIDSLVYIMGGSEDEPSGKARDPSNPRYLEAVLREAGLSKDAAKALLAKGLGALREAEGQRREAAPNEAENGNKDLLSTIRKLRIGG